MAPGVQITVQMADPRTGLSMAMSRTIATEPEDEFLAALRRAGDDALRLIVATVAASGITTTEGPR